jgi:heavy metal translocating P-type ATPase
MLYEAAPQDDPDRFRESELFKTCTEMGIIPQSESDLERNTYRTPSSEPPAASVAASGTLDHAGESTQNNSLSVTMKIHGMWCPACAWLIEESLRKSPGVLNVTCSFSTDWMRCHYDPVQTSPAEIAGMTARLGYQATALDEKIQAKEKSAEFVRLAVSAFLTMNIMMLSFALYSGFFSALSQNAISKLSWPSGIMASVVLFYGGRNIFRKAWTGFVSAKYSMETLIGCGSLAAYSYSTINLLSGSIHLYYDTAAMLVTLVLFGKILEGSAKGRVQEDLDSLFSLAPNKVRICTQSFPHGHYVAAAHLKKGDQCRVEEGEIVPADGLILEGSGIFDESSLTGEAQPVKKGPLDRIESGSRVLTGSILFRAERVGEDSTLGQMLQIMETALGQKTPQEGITDRILQWFVPSILILASITGLLCLLLGSSLEESIIRGITVTVISCPCALGIAIPLARVAGISGAGKKGILVRNFAAFEKSENVTAFVFDKTGTLTHGQWQLLDVIPCEGFSEEQVLSFALALEADSDHYIARVIEQRAAEAHIRPAQIEGIAFHKNGITGQIGENEVKIGSRDFLEHEIDASEDNSLNRNSYPDTLASLVYMGFGGKLCALFVFGDTVKEASTPTIGRLHSKGFATSLVSGDGDRITKHVGRLLKMENAHGDMLPKDKAAFVEQLQKEGQRIAMVGDGINDAPALVQSDLAITVPSGNNLGREMADITLMRGDPWQVLYFLALAQEVNRKVKQNFLAAFLYNTFCIPIAISGLLTPLVAVCAMLMSSLSVIGNTLLLAQKIRSPNALSIADSFNDKPGANKHHKGSAHSINNLA